MKRIAVLVAALVAAGALSGCTFLSLMTGAVEFTPAVVPAGETVVFTTTLATGGSTVGSITNLQMLGVNVNAYAYTDISVTHAGKTAMILSYSPLYDGTNTVNDDGSSGAKLAYEKLSSFAGDAVDGEWTVTIRNYDSSSITFTDMAINLFYWE